MNQTDYNLYSELIKFSTSHEDSAKLLAHSILDLKADPLVQLKQDDSTTLKPAVESNLVSIHESGIAFASENVRRWFYALNQVHKIGSDPEVITDVLKEHHSKYQLREFYIIAHNIFSVDVILLLKEISGNHFWTTCMSISQSLPHLKIAPESFANSLPEIFSKIINDGAANQFFNALKFLGEFQPETGQEVIEKIVSHPENKILAFVPSIFNGLSKSLGADKAFPQIESLSNRSEWEIVNIAISSLSQIDYEGSENGSVLLDKALVIYTNLQSKFPEQSATFAKAYGNLVNQTSKAKGELLSLSELTEPNTQYQMASILLGFEYVQDQQWYRKIVSNLSKVKAEHQGTLRMLNASLTGRISDDPSLVLDFFYLWIPYELRSGSDLVPFDHLFLQLFRTNRAFCEELLTIWLRQRDIKFQISAAHVLSMLWVHGHKNIQLSGSVLKTLSFDEIRIMVYKVLGFIYNSEHLESIMYSILELSNEDTKVRDLVISAFNQYIVYNFPSVTKFLKEKKASASVYGQYAIEQIELHWEEYRTQLNSLPDLNELAGSELRRKAYFKILNKRSKRNYKEMENQKDSIFSIARKIDLKMGKKWFSKNERGYSEKSELSLFQASAELPRGELLDPIGQARLRYHWKNSKIEE